MKKKKITDDEREEEKEDEQQRILDADVEEPDEPAPWENLDPV